MLARYGSTAISKIKFLYQLIQKDIAQTDAQAKQTDTDFTKTLPYPYTRDGKYLR